ncbi:MAG TPA: hypothetical protein VF223_08565 [Trebonia sp.]
MKRLLTAAALPVVLAAALVGVTGARHGAAAAPLADQGCILGLICLPSGSPSPTPTPSPSSASPTAGAPSSSPSPTSPGQPTASPGSSGPASAPPSAGAGPSPSGSGSPTPSGTATKAPQKHASASSGLVAASSTAVLTAGSATLTGFKYQGNVDVPTAGGPQSMMKFTADSISLSGNVTVTVTENGSTVTTVSATQDFSDGVTLYATKLSGSLLGVPLTFTPSTVSAVLLSLASVATSLTQITMTGVTTDQLLISGGTQVTTQLSMS